MTETMTSPGPGKLRVLSGWISRLDLALELDVTVETLHRWEKEGRLAPDTFTPGGHRRYDEMRLPAVSDEMGRDEDGDG
mgnify:CR=1 FL=1